MILLCVFWWQPSIYNRIFFFFLHIVDNQSIIIKITSYYSKLSIPVQLYEYMYVVFVWFNDKSSIIYFIYLVINMFRSNNLKITQHIFVLKWFEILWISSYFWNLFCFFSKFTHLCNLFWWFCFYVLKFDHAYFSLLCS